MQRGETGGSQDDGSSRPQRPGQTLQQQAAREQLLGSSADRQQREPQHRRRPQVESKCFGLDRHPPGPAERQRHEH